jgi:hypothetical protein
LRDITDVEGISPEEIEEIFQYMAETRRADSLSTMMEDSEDS